MHHQKIFLREIGQWEMRMVPQPSCVALVINRQRNKDTTMSRYDATSRFIHDNLKIFVLVTRLGTLTFLHGHEIHSHIRLLRTRNNLARDIYLGIVGRVFSQTSLLCFLAEMGRIGLY